MNDITALTLRMKAAAEKATPGEWWSDVVETDGEYGEGEDRFSGYHSYAVYVGSESLLDMTNSTAACIHEEWDHDYHMAWDETAKRNAEFIAVASPDNVKTLVEALEKAQEITAAAEKLVRCKGRYHSELNYRALASLFGVTTPDLPPLDGEPVGEVIEVGDALLVEWHKNLEEGAKLYTALQAPVMPFGLHPDTQKLVTDFCTALAEKLYKAQLKYGYDTDWKQDGWPSQCQAHFHQHIAKGDPRDVAAYCAFMWWHGWSTKPAEGLESRTVTVKLPTTRFWAGMIECYEKADVITAIREAGGKISND